MGREERRRMKVSREEQNIQGQMVLQCAYRAMVGNMQIDLQAMLTQHGADRGFAPRVRGVKIHEWLRANVAQS